MKKVILTGDRPTGNLHIGHYFGSIKNRVLLQDSYDTYIEATGSSDVIKKLRKNGHKIYIITSRLYTKEQSIKGELFRKMLEYWLKKNNIEYDKIIYCNDDKVVNDKYYVFEIRLGML